MDENKKICIKVIEKDNENSFLINTDDKTDIDVTTLEILITNMYDKFYRDLTSVKNHNSYSNKGDDKKEIILLFERVIKSLRYLVLEKYQVYKDIAEPLELLAQLCDMNNIDDLSNELISKYVSYYDNNEKMCEIKRKTYKIDLH